MEDGKQKENWAAGFEVDDESIPEPVVLKDSVEPEDDADAIVIPGIPAADDGPLPAWVISPEGLKYPRGRQAYFLRFRGEWTDTPKKGDRQCILWTLNDGDEKMAYARSMGDPNRAMGQLARQMVRAVDGHVVDWSGAPSPGNIDKWWSEIGGKCRSQIVRLYTKLHILQLEDQKDFFENCVAVRVVG